MKAVQFGKGPKKMGLALQRAMSKKKATETIVGKKLKQLSEEEDPEWSRW